MIDIQKLKTIAARYADTNSSELRVCNPATGELITTLPSASLTSVRSAISESVDAFLKWKTKGGDERSRVLREAGRQMLDRKESLASLLTLENGKPIREAEGEIEYAATFFEWFAEEARRIRGTTQRLSHNQELQSIYLPVGVCAAITPWNFPSAMITRKAGAALAAGCSMIVKPAPETPLSALAITDILEMSGAPRGLLTTVISAPEIFTDAIMEDSRVRKVSFTGSTATGRILSAQAGASLKRMTMELGGNAACIVYDDANLDDAINGALFSKFRNAGQTCVCINRFLLHAPIKEIFTKKLIDKVSQLVVGDGKHRNVDIGPLIHARGVKKVKNLVEDALAKGARLLHGALPDEQSNFVSPIVIDNASTDMEIFHQEIFGPVCVLYSFRDECDAIAMAQNTHAGLAGYVYSQSLSRVQRCATELEVGVLGVNETKISMAHNSFGGVKESGFGKEGGSEGIYEYLSARSILSTHS